MSAQVLYFSRNQEKCIDLLTNIMKKENIVSVEFWPIALVQQLYQDGTLLLYQLGMQK